MNTGWYNTLGLRREPFTYEWAWASHRAGSVAAAAAGRKENGLGCGWLTSFGPVKRCHWILSLFNCVLATYRTSDPNGK